MGQPFDRDPIRSGTSDRNKRHNSERPTAACMVVSVQPTPKLCESSRIWSAHGSKTGMGTDGGAAVVQNASSVSVDAFQSPNLEQFLKMGEALYLRSELVQRDMSSPLYGRRRFPRNPICYRPYFANFVCETARNALEKLVWKLSRIRGKSIHAPHCPQGDHISS